MPQVLQHNGNIVRNLTGAFGIDNCAPENIKSGVTIAGVTGTFEGGDTPDLSTLSWVKIKEYVDNGNAPAKWVGQYKEIESGTYQGYHFQCVDLYNGRYEKTDGTGYSKAVFMLKETTGSYSMNSSTNTYGGWSAMDLKTTLNTTFLQDLPQDIQNIISEVSIPCFIDASVSNNTAITYSIDKLFLPALYETLGYYPTDKNFFTKDGSPQYQLYNKSTTNWIKYNKSNNASAYRLRTTRTDLTHGFYIIQTNGNYTGVYNYAQYAVAPCFAI